MMMKILQRYIAKTMIIATALVALIITALLFIMTLLSELKNIGEGDYGFTHALIYVFMRMPSELYHFMPMIVLLGGILGLSMLSTYRELIVMRASGFAVKQIVASVLLAALILTLSVGVIGEWVAPKLSHHAEINKENIKNGGQAVVTATGVWLHVDNNFIHIEQVMGHNLLQGVTRYQFDSSHHLQATYYAKTLTLEDQQWTMHQAVKTSFNDNHTKSEILNSAPWNLRMNTNMLTVGLDPQQMTLPKIAGFVRYLDKNGLQSSEYRYEFWQRIFQPLSSLTMIFLAIPFVLGAMRGRALGVRMVIGVLLGFSFFILNAFLGQICIVYQIPAIMAAFLPILLFSGLGVFLSRQMVKQ